MKPKLIIITVAVLAVTAGGFFFLKSRYFAKPEKNELVQFLGSFNKQLKAGNTDSLMMYFETAERPEVLKRLLGLLSGKKELDGKSKPTIKLALDFDKAQISILSSELATASVSTSLQHDSVPDKQSTIVFRIHKTAPHQFKIIQIDARSFLTNYMAMNMKVKMLGVKETDIFAPETLEAFKLAASLKSRYDSVAYFQHMKNGHYFYVIKGNFSQYTYTDELKDKYRYKMGLVGPDLKEIIPVQYDLIHNIGGIADSLIEVEDGAKRGFYDITGKIVLPVEYDQILPLTNGDNIALISQGSDYFYLKMIVQ